MIKWLDRERVEGMLRDIALIVRKMGDGHELVSVMIKELDAPSVRHSNLDYLLQPIIIGMGYRSLGRISRLHGARGVFLEAFRRLAFQLSERLEEIDEGKDQHTGEE